MSADWPRIPSELATRLTLIGLSFPSETIESGRWEGFSRVPSWVLRFGEIHRRLAAHPQMFPIDWRAAVQRANADPGFAAALVAAHDAAEQAVDRDFIAERIATAARAVYALVPGGPWPEPAEPKLSRELYDETGTGTVDWTSVVHCGTLK